MNISVEDDFKFRYVSDLLCMLHCFSLRYVLTINSKTTTRMHIFSGKN